MKEILPGILTWPWFSERHGYDFNGWFVRKNGVTVDDDLEHGAKVGPFTVIDAHGKSPGEIALHWPERRLLLVGDACVGKPPGALALLPPKVIDDLPALLQTIKRLGQLDVETLLLGDGAPVLTGGSAALRALAGSFP